MVMADWPATWRLNREGFVAPPLATLAPHLTCIGVAGGISEAMIYASPRFPRATIVPAGTMQTPSLAAHIDGRPCTSGFVLEGSKR